MVEFTKEWLELENAVGGRTWLHGSIEEFKAQYDGLLQFLIPLMPPPSPNVDTKDGEVDGVNYRVYTPKEASGKGPLPVGVYTHGGGWLLGDLNGEDALCRAIAEFSPCIIVSVDYKMAPEVQWPVPLQDTLTVFKWARMNASSIGGDPEKLFTIGGSAGGQLALAVANRIVATDKKSSLKGVVAMVPATVHYENVPEEYKSQHTSVQDNKEAPVLAKESMDSFYSFIGAKKDDPDFFPLLNKDNLKNYPPTYFAVCEGDPLRDDGIIMEGALKKAGVPTKLDFYKGLPHYFWIYPQIPQGQEFVMNLIGGVHWIVGQMKQSADRRVALSKGSCPGDTENN